MPKTKEQGQSIATPDKEFGLDAILRMHISIVKRVLENRPYFPQRYFFFDICCGSGFNGNENCDGSPIVFLKAVSELGLKYHAVFIDKNPDCTDQLKERIRPYKNQFSSCDVFTEENSSVLHSILNQIPKYALGLIYSDPNGISDFDLLADAARTSGHLDILLRHPAAAAKRNGKRLDCEIRKIEKIKWLVRSPLLSDRWQAALLFGTNYAPYKEWKKHRFFSLDTSEGKSIFAKLNFTTKELCGLNQVNFLADADPKNQVINRSNGFCELCHTQPLDDIHHLSYIPPETPDKLLGLCHQCHCEIHGKEN